MEAMGFLPSPHPRSQPPVHGTGRAIHSDQAEPKVFPLCEHVSVDAIVQPGAVVGLDATPPRVQLGAVDLSRPERGRCRDDRALQAELRIPQRPTVPVGCHDAASGSAPLTKGERQRITICVDCKYVVWGVPIVETLQKSRVDRRGDPAGNDQGVRVTPLDRGIRQLQHFGVELTPLPERYLGMSGAKHIGERLIHLIPELPGPYGGKLRRAFFHEPRERLVDEIAVLVISEGRLMNYNERNQTGM